MKKRIIIICMSIISQYILAEGENIGSQSEGEKGTTTVISAQELRKQKILDTVEAYFPTELIEKKRKLLEESFKRQGVAEDKLKEKVEKRLKLITKKSFQEINLDPLKKKGKDSVALSEEKEIVCIYSVGESNKLVILKKVKGRYIKQWETEIGGTRCRVEDIRDINNDSQKEIIVTCNVGMRIAMAIHIYSWNGVSGSLITPYLVASSGFYPPDDIKDLDGDKIDEIIVSQNISALEGGPVPAGTQIETYKWNLKERMYKLWKTERKKGEGTSEEEWRKIEERDRDFEAYLRKQREEESKITIQSLPQEKIKPEPKKSLEERLEEYRKSNPAKTESRIQLPQDKFSKEEYLIISRLKEDEIVEVSLVCRDNPNEHIQELTQVGIEIINTTDNRIKIKTTIEGLNKIAPSDWIEAIEKQERKRKTRGIKSIEEPMAYEGDIEANKYKFNEDVLWMLKLDDCDIVKVKIFPVSERLIERLEERGVNIIETKGKEVTVECSIGMLKAIATLQEVCGISSEE
ncbi:MAG: hypothetical protein AB1630_11015 [bacterium]